MLLYFTYVTNVYSAQTDTFPAVFPAPSHATFTSSSSVHSPPSSHFHSRLKNTALPYSLRTRLRGLSHELFMAALCNRGPLYFCPVVSFYLSIFFLSSPNLSGHIGCLPYFHTWCGLSANLRCRSETCCTRLAENTGRKKVAKNRHLGTIAQLCRAISSQRRHVSTIRK